MFSILPSPAHEQADYNKWIHILECSFVFILRGNLSSKFNAGIFMSATLTVDNLSGDFCRMPHKLDKWSVRRTMIF